MTLLARVSVQSEDAVLSNRVRGAVVDALPPWVVHFHPQLFITAGYLGTICSLLARVSVQSEDAVLSNHVRGAVVDALPLWVVHFHSQLFITAGYCSSSASLWSGATQ
jgi:hypothetical protein